MSYQSDVQSFDTKEYYLRPYNKEDLAFISSSWGKAYYRGSVYYKLMNAKEFDEKHRPLRNRALNSKETTIIICSAKNDPLLIMGWMCIEVPRNKEGMLLHFLYVKEAFRNQGLAKDMLAMIDTYLSKQNLKNIMYTHLTVRARNILKNNEDKYKQYFYTPHLI